MILGLFWFIVANLAAVLAASAIVRRIRTGQLALDLLLFLLVRLTLISATVLLAGFFYVLTQIGLGLLGASILFFLIASGEHRKIPRLHAPDTGKLMGLFTLLVGLRLVLQVWFFSPHLGDALAYHLPKIAEWVQAGGFTHEMGIHPHVTFPAGFELVETWWVVFLKHDVLIEMAGVEFLLLAFSATYVIAEHLRLTPRWAFFAGLLYVMTPGLHLTTTSCLNDGPAAALVLVTAALLVRRVPLPFVIMTVGLGLGVKPTYGFTLPGLALLWWLLRREPRLSSEGAPRLAIVLGVLGIAIGSSWYARNILQYGNPFYPLGSPEVVNPAAVQLGPRLSSLPENASNLINTRIYDNGGTYGANVDNISGWGGVAFACGLVALLIIVRIDSRFRRLAAAFGLALGSTLLFIQNDLWCLKYVFFFPAILCIATAQLAQVHHNVVGVAGAGLLFSFVGTFFPYDLQPEHVKALANQPWKSRTAIVLRELDVSQDRIGCFGGYTANAYHLYGPSFTRKVVYLRAESAESLLKDIASSELQVVYAAPFSAEQREILETCIRRDRIRPLGGRFYSVTQ